MIVRSPLVPCSSASQSCSRSHVCQNGEDQRPATKPKLTRCTPPSRMFMINRWPSTSTTSSSPDTRMKTQLYISKLVFERPPPGRRRRVRGSSIGSYAVGSRVAVTSPPSRAEERQERRAQHEEGAGRHQPHEDHQLGP